MMARLELSGTSCVWHRAVPASPHRGCPAATAWTPTASTTSLQLRDISWLFLGPSVSNLAQERYKQVQSVLLDSQRVYYFNSSFNWKNTLKLTFDVLFFDIWHFSQQTVIKKSVIAIRRILEEFFFDAYLHLDY